MWLNNWKTWEASRISKESGLRTSFSRIWPRKVASSKRGINNQKAVSYTSKSSLYHKQSPIIESIYSGFTHNPHHLILDSVPLPKNVYSSRLVSTLAFTTHPPRCCEDHVRLDADKLANAAMAKSQKKPGRGAPSR